MIFLSDLATPEGRAAASAKSKSMDKDPLVYDLFAVRHASDKGSTTTASHQPPFLRTVQVIIHRGTAFQGHYFAYIRDTTGKGKWKPEKTPTRAVGGGKLKGSGGGRHGNNSNNLSGGTGLHATAGGASGKAGSGKSDPIGAVAGNDHDAALLVLVKILYDRGGRRRRQCSTSDLGVVRSPHAVAPVVLPSHPQSHLIAVRCECDCRH